MTETKDIARKAFKGVIWNYLTFASGKLVVFITTIILVRILLPEDFGLLAMGLIVLNYLDVLANFGIGTAIIYFQEDLGKMLNTAFFIVLLVGIGLTAAAILVAPMVAAFFKEPRLVDIVQVLSLSVLITSLGSIQEETLKKHLDFKKRFGPQLSRTIAKGVVSIGMALLGFGVWSLVFGQIAGVLTSTIYFWIIGKWFPKFQFDPKIARALLGYGLQIILLGLLSAFHRNIDYILIGQRMDSEQLGLYTLAYRLPELLIISLAVVVGQAVFPAYSKLQNDSSTLKRSFLVMMQYMSLASFALGFGMMVIAPEFVRFFYTEKWVAAIPVMQVLAGMTAIDVLGYNAGDIYKATGRPSIINKIAVVKICLVIPIYYIAAQYSILHVAFGQLVVGLSVTVLTLFVASRILSLSIKDMLVSIRPATIGAIVMIVVTYAVRLLIGDMGDLPRMIILIIVGGIAYIGTIWMINKTIIRQALVFVTPQKKKQLRIVEQEELKTESL